MLLIGSQQPGTEGFILCCYLPTFLPAGLQVELVDDCVAEFIAGVGNTAFRLTVKIARPGAPSVVVHTAIVLHFVSS